MTPERKQRLLSVLNKRQTNITVVLENVFDPHNISAVLRSCDAVGIQDVYVLTTRMAPHQRWGYRSSSGAYKWITVHQFNETQACVTVLRKNYQHILTTCLTHESVNLYEIDFTQSLALVFGNEKDGVSSEMKNLCDGNFLIPQVGMIKSLNISVACGVTLYEAYRQKQMAGHYSESKLPIQQIDMLLNNWGYQDE
ncbi:MAG: RNA methyltransferase [Chitinophagaceae bacterium]|jgi:tRNA (guanosine-2'-O-)-methyltransferase|nr:RNA methyltransferase [Chitinophagaceae bacterium]